MKITRLHVSAFRNIARLDLVPGPGLNVFEGANGQGKTNLLEAIFVSVRGKSFRPYTARTDWVPLGGAPPTGTSVLLELEDSQGFGMDVGLRRAGVPRWEYFLNAKRSTSPHIREKVPVVVFSPDDHALIRSGPEQRRDYLDEIFTDVVPGYAEVLGRFEKALKQRNRVLRANERPLAAELLAWTRLLAEASSDLSQLRREMWRPFAERFMTLGAQLFPELGAKLKVEFRPDLSVPDEGFEYDAATYLEHIQSSYEADLATGWSHRGPQRDDFVMSLAGVPSRSGASQGQARLLALLLKWVHADWVQAERRELPLFLIDDFSSELDAHRRDLLLKLLRDSQGQIFLTGTDATSIDFSGFADPRICFVNSGSFCPAK